MKLGTMAYKDKIYNLEYMTVEQINDLKNKIIKLRKELFITFKKILKGDEIQNSLDAYISDLKKINELLKKEAILEKAYCDKLSIQSIEQKTSAQITVIDYEIKKINSKFNEKSKNYNLVKERISVNMTKYEEALKNLSLFYDEEIEKLIIKKFELQIKLANLYLIIDELSKEIENNDSNLKKKVVEGIKNALHKFTRVKKDKKAKNKLDYDKIQEKIDKNKVVIDEISKEIRLISKKIKELNDTKNQKIINAMESEDKALSTKIKKPKTFEKITRFFSSRINAYKVILKTVIEPFENKIEQFIESQNNIKW